MYGSIAAAAAADAADAGGGTGIDGARCSNSDVSNK